MTCDSSKQTEREASHQDDSVKLRGRKIAASQKSVFCKKYIFLASFF